MRGHNFSVLVVDDQPGIRDVAGRTLREAGFDVAGAVDGSDALRQMAARKFDLVLLDVIMPEREGLETLQQIRLRWPDARVVMMSGGGRINPEHLLKLASMLGCDRTLRKPFRKADLLEVVGATLDLRLGAEAVAG